MGFSKNHPWSYFQNEYLKTHFRKIDKTKSKFYKQSVGGGFQKNHPWQKYIAFYGKKRYKALRSRSNTKKVTKEHINKNMKSHSKTKLTAFKLSEKELNLIERYGDPQMYKRLLKRSDTNSLRDALNTLQPENQINTLTLFYFKYISKIKLKQLLSKYNTKSKYDLINQFDKRSKDNIIKIMIKEFKFKEKEKKLKQKQIKTRMFFT